MTQKGYCKICSYFDHCKWHKEGFQKKVAEGSSLRILQAYLQALGLECDLKTISKHIRICEGIALKQQRGFERSLRKKGRDAIEKLQEFFKPQKLPNSSEGCEHLRTIQFYDLAREKVFTRCSDCGVILGRGIDPEENERRMAKDHRNWKIYESLRRRGS